MKIQTAIILIFCVILSSCTKKEIIDESQTTEIPEVQSNFDEGFYQRVNHYFSLEHVSKFYTIDNFPVIRFFSKKNVYNQDKIQELKIYIINELNEAFFLSEKFKYEEGCIIERWYNRSSYSDFFEYDNEKRTIKIITNGKSLSYKYICDFENNVYICIDDRNDKVIIKKTSYGYELQNEKTHHRHS